MADAWVESAREDFPVLHELVYLDSASVSPSPRPVLDAVAEYARDYPFNIGDAAFGKGREAGTRANEARRAVAEFVGAASPAEITFTKNTTEALNVAAAGLRWRAGDEVVITGVEHASNVLPWLRLAQREGIVVRVVEARRDGYVGPEEVERAMGQRTRLVSVSHASNLLGTILPIREIGERVKRRSALYMVDYAQSAGRMPVQVADAHCDLAAFCGRKGLMGPQGSGFLWGRLALLEEMEPLIIGGRGATVTGDVTFDYARPYQRFEAGVTNTGALIGLGAAVAYLRGLGLDRIRAQIRKTAIHLLEGLRAIPGIEVYGPEDPDLQAGLISWNVRGLEPNAVAAVLDREARVAVKSGSLGAYFVSRALGIDLVVRTSLHFYNTDEEIDVLLRVVRGIAAQR